MYVSWFTSELRVLFAPRNRFKPFSKIVYWPFQGGTSFVDILCCFFLSCVCYAFVRVCSYVPCGHLLWKGWPLGSRLWCLTVSLLLSHWYPDLSVALDCIDSWSLHPYLFSPVCQMIFKNVAPSSIDVSCWRDVKHNHTHTVQCSRDMWFQAIWQFDKWILRRTCAASF